MMDEEYPWLIEGGGIAKYINGVPRQPREEINTYSGLLNQKIWLDNIEIIE